MSELWALTASASDVDAETRSIARGEIEAWLAAGGCGVALATCHRVELYGFGDPPALRAVRLTGRPAITHLLRVACGLESVMVRCSTSCEVLAGPRSVARCSLEASPGEAPPPPL